MQPSIISSRQVIFLDQASGHNLNLALFGVDIAAYGTVNIDISLGDNIAVKADAAGDNRGGRFAETANGDALLSTGVATVCGVASTFLFFFKHMVNPMILKMKTKDDKEKEPDSQARYVDSQHQAIRPSSQKRRALFRAIYLLSIRTRWLPFSHRVLGTASAIRRHAPTRWIKNVLSRGPSYPEFRP